MNLSNYNQASKQAQIKGSSLGRIILAFVISGILLLGIMWIFPIGSPFWATVSSIFALSSDQAMWYITRAAGMIAYLLLWLSTVWGLVLPTKLLNDYLSGDFSFDFHQFISLLSLGFLGLHVVVLTADKFLPFSIAQLLIPFLSPYRPLWVGIGILSFYLLLLVTITFYLRKRIGMKTFRYIHYTSLIAYLGAVMHAFLSGTDSSLPAVMFIYFFTVSVVIFLTVYWVVKAWINRSAENSPVITTHPRG
jgi:sulfoxide reductase heme-binding subunit YedZ